MYLAFDRNCQHSTTIWVIAISEVAAAREALRKIQPTLDPKRLVFIDECAVTAKMTCLYGRALQGDRLLEKVPHGHRKATALICGLRCNGVTSPLTLEGAIDGLHFLGHAG